MGISEKTREEREWRAWRDEEMVTLREGYGMSLEEIGKIFGVTRERVRQIVGNTGNLNYEMKRERVEEIARPELSDVQVAKMAGVKLNTVRRIRYGEWRMANCRDRGIGKGRKWQLWMRNKLIEVGYDDVKLVAGENYHIIVNGEKRVWVSSAIGTTPPSLKAVNPRYHFRVMRNESVTDVDYYACICADLVKKVVFMIPSSSFGRVREAVYITWPTARPEIGKFQRYADNFDLYKD